MRITVEKLMYASFAGAASMYVMTIFLYFRLRIKEAYRAVRYMRSAVGQGKTAGGKPVFHVTERQLIIHADVPAVLILACAAWLAAAQPAMAETAGEYSVCVRMEGEEGPDGRYYCRADNCGIRVIIRPPAKEEQVFSFEAEIDGRADLRRRAEPDDSCETWSVFFSSYDLSSVLEDGAHRVSVKENTDGGVRILDIADCTGAACDGAGAEFILDTVPPHADFSCESSGASRKERTTPGDRWYYNSDCSAVVRISEEYADPGSFLVMKGDFSGSGCDASSISVTEPGQSLDGRAEDGGAVYEDRVLTDGVVRYFAYGRDYAGNSLEYGEGFEEDGASYHIVRDTLAPLGFMNIFAGGALCYSCDTKGNVIYADIMKNEEEAEVCFSADTGSELSPVLIRGSIATSDGKKLSAATETFCHDGSAVIGLKGGRTILGGEIYLEDLAGNQSAGVFSDPVFLDHSPPEIPVFDIVSGSAPAEGNMFREDVEILFEAADPEEGGGSGIGDVTAGVYADGGTEPVMEQVLHRRNRSVFSGEVKEEQIEYRFSGSFPVGSEWYSDHITVRLSVSDNAGNRTERELFLGMDARPPVIAVDFADNPADEGPCFRDERKARITVEERHFSPEMIRIRVNEKEIYPEWTPGRGEIWESELCFSREGAYSLEVTGADIYGNESEAVYGGSFPQKFLIDRTKPVVSIYPERFEETPENVGICYINDGTYAEIRVEDSHFEGEHSLVITSPKDSKTAGEFTDGKLRIDFDREGIYTLEGTVRDTAGNESDYLELRTWVVDRTAPCITISGAADGSANSFLPKIAIRVKDLHPDPDRIRVWTWNREGEKHQLACECSPDEEGLLCLPSPITEDGYYILRCEAGDLAGNTAENSISFSVNRQGPAFRAVTPHGSGTVMTKPVKVEIEVEDIDPFRVLSAQINGEDAPFSVEENRIQFDELQEEDGKYVVTLDVKDAAGRRSSMDPLEFMIDRTPPSLTLDVEGGSVKQAGENAEIALLADDPDARLVELLLDGNHIEEKCVFRNGKGILTLTAAAPGKHVISAKIADAAGNTGENVQSAVIFRRGMNGLVIPSLAAGAVLAAAVLLISGKKKENGAA